MDAAWPKVAYPYINSTMNASDPHRATVLFDEFGTPTFRTDRESDYFLGVGVVYPREVEDDLFKQADELFGLSNRNPLKNSRIAVPRAENIKLSPKN